MAAKTSLTKRFRGETAQKAEAAALKWANDLIEHGPLAVESIIAVKKVGKFVATITYHE